MIQKFVRGFESSNDIQDPTYLGFTIMFDYYHSPLFNGTETKITNESDKGAITEDDLVNEQLSINNGTYQTPEALDLSSSCGYLRQIGENVRLNYLRNFGQQLKYVNQNLPWYWQGIEGLDNVWESYHDITKAYMAGDDAIITIKTLESLDFKILGLMEMYNKAVYDFTYRRQVIPSNLLEFDMYIYVADLRVFRPLKDRPQGVNTTTPKYDLGSAQSMVIFRLKILV